MSTYIDLWNHKSKKTYVEVIINCVLYSHIDSWDKESYTEREREREREDKEKEEKKKLQRSQPQSCSSRAASGESQDPLRGRYLPPLPPQVGRGSNGLSQGATKAGWFCNN